MKNCEPYVVIGPEGSGKNILINKAIENLR